MSSNQDPHYPGNQDQPNIDKTFVEGSMPNPIFPDLKPGAKVNATTLGTTNPYTQTGSRTQSGSTQTGTSLINSVDMLPSGNEPIPLGSGTIASLLGSGGMAKVYKIWNEKLEVFRAVKILIPGQTDLKNRFDTEAKITAKLHHPNIVEIYNVGEWNNLPYLEMEYIDGLSLESFIAKHGKLPDVVCSSIAIYVARALAYAHSQEFLIYGKNYHGVIHRDLKPANIMISNSGEVRLMDFGIARPTEASLHTVEGNIVGTMQYLSPEQMDGIDIDNRTDIYSFGAILYEMLTGTKTFPQDTITNLMKKKIMNEYRKFSEFEFEVSSGLAKISQKCLQINKEDRYPSVEMLLRELESAHKALMTETPGKVLRMFITDPESIAGKKNKAFLKKHLPKVLFGTGGITVLGALIAVFFLTGPKQDTSKQVSQTTPQATTSDLKPQAPSVEPPQHTETSSEGLKPLASPPPPIVKKTEPVPVKTTTPAISNSAQGKQQGTPIKTDIKKPVPPKEPELSPLDNLKKKYSNDDFMTIGKQALRSGAPNDAVLAFENVPDAHPDSRLKSLLLFEAYLESGRTKDALFIANNDSPVDAQYDFLCGKLYQKMGKLKQALDYLQSALTKPSIVRNRNEIRNDALYNTALIWSELYKSNPTPDSRIQVLNAWNTVKRLYSNNMENPRFKRANTELASIQ